MPGQNHHRTSVDPDLGSLHEGWTTLSRRVVPCNEGHTNHTTA
jgi:hypothetical protein